MNRDASRRAAASSIFLATRSGYVTLPMPVLQGRSWSNSWNTTTRSGPGRETRRPSSSTAPRAGAMNPATDLSSVDLPQPDGPSRMNFSPFVTSKDTSSTAVNVPLSVG